MKYVIMSLMMILLSGCAREYVYIAPPYTYNNCTYTNEIYFSDYMNNKDKYCSYDQYMYVNYGSNNPYVNASNARRAYRNIK